ncbi:MAG: hypothetical protein J6B75_02990 [Ruminococcus sp.]|nr:hypothetical protein [Ruminococcus sp.]
MLSGYYGKGVEGLKYKLLVGNNIEGSGKKLAQTLSYFGFTSEYCTNSFKNFEELLSKVSYDGLIFFALRITDNTISFIQECKSNYPNMKIYPIITSDLTKVKKQLIDVGADACITMPYTDYSLCADIIGDFYTSDEMPILPEIADFLWRRRFPGHMLGFYSLCSALEIAIETPESLEKITIGLYPAIAEKINSTYENVERSLRVMLLSAFNNGVIINGKLVHRRIKNKELIKLLADEYIEENGIR